MGACQSSPRSPSGETLQALCRATTERDLAKALGENDEEKCAAIMLYEFGRSLTEFDL